MAEQKVKPATKKVANTASKTSDTTSKITAAPKTASEKPEKIPAAKKAKAPAAEKKAYAAPSAVQPTPEERYRMVETAAYFIAERDGFSGNSFDYWTAAELEIANSLRL